MLKNSLYTTDNITQITDFTEQNQKFLLFDDHTYVYHYVEKQEGFLQEKDWRIF